MENAETSKRPLFIYGFLGFLAFLMVASIITGALTGTEWATITQGDAQAYVVSVADNSLERARGLSKSEPSDLGDAVGMLFVYDNAEPRTFTMRGMNYNLDFLWLKNGRIVKIDQNVPAPGPGEEPETVSSYPLDVDMVIEMPAGAAFQLQYLVGHELTVNLDVDR